MLKTYVGGCFCGEVRYEAQVDLEAEGTGRCNCTWCTKNGWWTLRLNPEAFRLVRGEAPVRQEGAWATEHRCPTCHVIVSVSGDQPEAGGAFVSLNVRTLEGVSLDGARVTYRDGLHDTWEVLGEVRWHDPLRQLSQGVALG